MGNPHQIISRLKEIGHTAAAITDHGEMYMVLEFEEEMRKAGLRPVIGLEAYMVENMERRGAARKDDESGQTILGDQRAHITLLAGSLKGYQNLLNINRESYSRGFYYKPRVDWDCIVKYQEGLIVLSGCLGGMLSRQITQGKEDVAFGWMRHLSQRIERFYVELIPCPDIESSLIACQALHKMAKELRLPMVLTNDAHFPRAEDHAVEDAMVCVGLGTTMDDETRRVRLAKYHYLCEADELAARARHVIPDMHDSEIRAALRMTSTIANSIDYELPKSTGPVYPLDGIMLRGGEQSTVTTLLEEWVKRGKERRIATGQIPCYLPVPYGEDHTPTYDMKAIAVYEARERRELDIVKKFGFENYFLIVTDIVEFVYSLNQLCIARGSCGGSLLCWYLRITQVDPIKFDLPMERFIEESRSDEPDIDLDMPKDIREEVLIYLTKKYGNDKCGAVAAISYYRTGQSIRDIGRVFKVPSEVVNQLASIVPKVLDVDSAVKTEGILRRFFEDNATAKDIIARYPALQMAADLEGQMRHSTVHAAGYVVNDEPIHSVCSVIQKPGELPIIAATKDYVAKRGLLKIDVLSLDTLDVISQCVQVIGKDIEWLETLPIDNKAVYDMLSTGMNAGIFQLQGGSCGPLMKQLKPQDFHDVVALSVLCRPGPLQSGGTHEYIERKYGRMSLPDYHPLIMDIIRPTWGVIIYQEQCMRLGSDVGGFSPERVHKFRKYITSTMYGAADLEKEFLEEYMAGADAREIPADQARHVWTQAQKAGNYSFNKAHAYAYGLLGYWTAYFKRHYPAIFTSTTASRDGDKDKRIRLFADFKSVGGKLEFLHYDKSLLSFRAATETTLVGGFMDLEGVGPVIANKLIAGQPYGSWESFLAACQPSLRAKIQRTGVHLGEPDMAEVSLLAPWLVDMTWQEIEKLYVKHKPGGIMTIGDVLSRIENGAGTRDVKVYGKITSVEIVDMYKAAKKYGSPPPKEGEPFHRALVTVTDDTGSLSLYYNRWKWAQLLEYRKPLQGIRGDGIGNGAEITGEISADYQRCWGIDLMVVSPLERRSAT